MTVYVVKQGSVKHNLARFTCRQCDTEFLADHHSYEASHHRNETSYNTTCVCCGAMVYTGRLEIMTQQQLENLNRSSYAAPGSALHPGPYSVTTGEGFSSGQYP